MQYKLQEFKDFFLIIFVLPALKTIVIIFLSKKYGIKHFRVKKRYIYEHPLFREIKFVLNHEFPQPILSTKQNP